MRIPPWAENTTNNSVIFGLSKLAKNRAYLGPIGSSKGEFSTSKLTFLRTKVPVRYILQLCPQEMKIVETAIFNLIIRLSPPAAKYAPTNRFQQPYFPCAGLGHIGKERTSRVVTTRRLPCWANGLFYPDWNRLHFSTALQINMLTSQG